MNDIRAYLEEKYAPWGWMGQRAHDAEAIGRILSLSFIISCDYGSEVPLFFDKKNVLSVEKISQERKNWTNEALAASLSGQLGDILRMRLKSHTSRLNLLSYRSVSQLEENSANFFVSPYVLAMPEKLKRHFDNKILFQKNIGSLSLPCMVSVIGVPAHLTFELLRNELGVPFVVQFPYGSSGNSTYVIRCPEEYEKVKNAGEGEALIREYISGYSMNVNAVIVSTSGGLETLCCYPSVQITGAPECSNSRMEYCGNDYTATACVDKKVISEIERQVKITGKWMAGSGYRGIFGMDFLVGKGKVYPIEVNPRFQNSTSFHIAAGLSAGTSAEDLIFLHIAEFFKKEDEVLDKFVENIDGEKLMEPVRGSQIILHNIMHDRVVGGTLNPGVYSAEGEGIELRKRTASFKDLERTEEILVTCGVPPKSLLVRPGAPLCKIQSLSNLIELSRKRCLTSEARRAVKDVYSAIGLKDVSGITEAVV